MTQSVLITRVTVKMSDRHEAVNLQEGTVASMQGLAGIFLSPSCATKKIPLPAERVRAGAVDDEVQCMVGLAQNDVIPKSKNFILINLP